MHPLFILSALALKTAIKAWKRGEPVERIRCWLDRTCKRLLARYPTRSSLLACDFIHPSVALTGPYSGSDWRRALLERLHWQRYHEVFWQAVQKSEAGDMKAFSRVMKTTWDFQRRRFNPNWEPVFYSDPDHATLCEIGRGLGLETLTADERAECFDRLCPCGKEHDADALKKQYQRMKRDLEKAMIGVGRGNPQSTD